MRIRNKYYSFCLIVLSLLLSVIYSKAQNFDTLFNKAGEKYRAKEYDTAAKLFEKAFPIAGANVNKLYALYNGACSRALSGNNEKAFEDLNLAMDSGWTNFKLLSTDPDFSLLRSDERWALLMQKVTVIYTQRENSYYWGMYFGVLFVFFFYNLFLFISLKDISFLYYSLSIFFLAHFEIIRTSDFGMYLTKLFFWYNCFSWVNVPFTFFVSVGTIFFLLLARSFMRLKEVLPLANKIVHGLIALLILIIILSQLKFFAVLKIANSAIFICYISTFIMGILLWVKGYKHVRYFVIAGTVLTISTVLLLFNELGIGHFDFRVGVFRFDNVGVMAFYGLLSFALADRINLLKREKEGAQEKALEVLEEKVKERTFEIVEQKELVEEKQREILDSITYAKRLQDAILPPLSLIRQYLPESFVLYKPKDIVAGDFYWMEHFPLPVGEGQGEVVLIAAADCTGHGVPGAMVSVVCSNALNRTVKEFKITETGKILDKVRELVLETFEKSEDNVQDGMDISLCNFNTKTNELQWSGANNPLWYIHNGALNEVPADKQPIGKYEKAAPFKTHHITLQKGDMLYLFTDGYADQFGGPKGKKFKYKQLLECLVAVGNKPLQEQKKILEETFETWKRDLEQVDDLLIIGIKV
jgi:serine phosphatase RsbU (regulator of sigma subunit)